MYGSFGLHVIKLCAIFVPGAHGGQERVLEGPELESDAYEPPCRWGKSDAGPLDISHRCSWLLSHLSSPPLLSTSEPLEGSEKHCFKTQFTPNVLFILLYHRYRVLVVSVKWIHFACAVGGWSMSSFLCLFHNLWPHLLLHDKQWLVCYKFL